MKKTLIVAIAVLVCGAASAAVISLNGKSQISELTKSNIEALTGIIVRPKTGNGEAQSHNPRIPFTGETTTTTTTTEKYVPFCLNMSSEPCTE